MQEQFKKMKGFPLYKHDHETNVMGHIVRRGDGRDLVKYGAILRAAFEVPWPATTKVDNPRC
jgi:hypothetical protein